MKKDFFRFLLVCFFVLMFVLSSIPVDKDSFLFRSDVMLVSVDDVGVVAESVEIDLGNSGSTYSNYQRKLAYNSTGVLYCVYQNFDNIVLGISNNDGDTWSLVNISGVSGEAEETTYNQWEPSLVIDSSDNLHIVWNGYIDELGDEQIRYVNSSDGGVSWGGVINLTTNTSLMQFEASIALDSSDNLHIVWYGEVDETGERQIRYSKSVDGGISWSSIINITSDSTYDQDGPNIVVNSSNDIFVAWSGRHSGSPSNSQIRYSKSVDGGISWSEINNITSGSYYQYYPCAVIDGSDNVHVVWYGKHAGTSYNQIRYSKSVDGGISWSSIINITSDSTYDQMYPSICLDGSNDIFVAWSGRHSGSPSNSQIRSISYDGNWGTVVNLTSSADDNIAPSSLWSMYPVGKIIPLYGFCFIYFNDLGLYFYKSDTFSFDELNEPIGFVASEVVGVNDTLSLSWIKGGGATYTRIQYKLCEYPTSISDGTNAYNDTGVSKDVTGLSEGTTYYFRAWSWNETSGNWSSGYASAYNTTYSDVIYVDDDAGSCWYNHYHVRTVQEGIDNASAGDTVSIWAGTYVENVIVNKSVDIIGNGTVDTMIYSSGNNYNGLFNITSDWVNVSGLVFSNCLLGDQFEFIPTYTAHSIRLYTNYTSISNCLFYDCYYGIDLGLSSYILINNNTFQNVLQYIVGDFYYNVYNGTNITITNNTVDSDERCYSPYIYGYDNVTFTNNYENQTGQGHIDDGNHITIHNNVFDNLWNFWRIGDLKEVYNVTVSDNYFYTNSSDSTGCLFLEKCEGIIEDNVFVGRRGYEDVVEICTVDPTSSIVFRNNVISSDDLFSIGLGVWGSIFDLSVYNNSIFNCTYAIYLDEHDGVAIFNNTLCNNNYSIFVDDSGDNEIYSNFIYDNDVGIAVKKYGFLGSNNNLIYNNYFDNVVNAVGDSECDNLWNISKTLGTNIIGGPYLGGNYWSDYAGFDTDNDGLGDTLTPYDSGGGIASGGDYHPLVLPMINICVYNESNCSEMLVFDIIISNKAGTQVYEQKDCEYCVSIPMHLCPYGNDTIIKIDSDGYNFRLFYVDLLPENGNFSMDAYLPQKITEGEQPNCGFRVKIDTLLISNPAVDAVLGFAFEPDSIVGVYIYNESLYRTVYNDTYYSLYGGWVEVSSDEYSYNSTTLIINSSVLDSNTSRVKVEYYYEYCQPQYGSYLYQLSVHTELNNPIEGAKITVKRYINCTGVFEIMSTLYSDGAGNADVYLIPGALYQFSISKSSYTTSLSYWTPTNSIFTKVFQLKPDISVYPNATSPSECIRITVGYNSSHGFVNLSSICGAFTNFSVWVYEINLSSGVTSYFYSYNGTDTASVSLSFSINTSNNYVVKIYVNHSLFASYWTTLYITPSRTPPTSIAEFDSLFDAIFGKNNVLSWSAISGLFIFIVCLFAFDQRNAGLGLVITGIAVLGINAWIGLAFIGVTVCVFIIVMGVLLQWKISRRYG